MISKVYILTIAVLYLFVPGIHGQDCVPTQVVYISLTADSVLYWHVHPKEPCTVDEFMVDIVGDRDDAYHFTTKETSVDLSFLEFCEEWTFVVTPIAAGVKGYERQFVGHVPLPAGTDLSIAYLYVFRTEPRSMWLMWNLGNINLGNCTLEYRIVVEDQETGGVQDLYASGSFLQVNNISPCVAYELSIRAINRAQPTIEGPIRITPFTMPAHAETAPTVNNIKVGTTTADLRFNLEGFNNNRCPVRTLYVDSGNNFNISIPLTNTEGERPPVEVNLKGLRPDSMYLLRVSVENSGGISPPAQIAVQTLPVEPGRQ